MTSNKERQLAYGIATVLLIVGVLSYTALSAKGPAEPVRLMFQNKGGNVLFDHQIHAEDYGYACEDCHHHPPGDEILDACGKCHTSSDSELPEFCMECHDPEMVEPAMVRADAFHTQCGGCHEEIGAGPMINNEDCTRCHMR